MSLKTGILAYGSLIDDPGDELSVLIDRTIPCLTPFNVEYARSSSTRGNAATLIPVSNGGAMVKACILVLKDDVSIEHAADVLWRREIRTSDTTRKYNHTEQPGINSVQIKRIRHFNDIDTVLYTFIASNIDIITPTVLADLAIASILGKAGEKRMDGLRYLNRAIANGIYTPMTEEFRKLVLRKAGASDLREAISILDSQRTS